MELTDSEGKSDGDDRGASAEPDGLPAEDSRPAAAGATVPLGGDCGEADPGGDERAELATGLWRWAHARREQLRDPLEYFSADGMPGLTQVCKVVDVLAPADLENINSAAWRNAAINLIRILGFAYMPDDWRHISTRPEYTWSTLTTVLKKSEVREEMVGVMSTEPLVQWSD